MKTTVIKMSIFKIISRSCKYERTFCRAYIQTTSDVDSSRCEPKTFEKFNENHVVKESISQDLDLVISKIRIIVVVGFHASKGE